MDNGENFRTSINSSDGFFGLVQLIFIKLKADRPYPRYYPYTPPDYRHTDKYHRVMTDGQMYRQTDGCYQFYYVPALLKLHIDKNDN